MPGDKGSKGIGGFNVLRRKLMYSFMKGIHTSENPLIQAIVQRGKFQDSVVNLNPATLVVA